MWTRCSTHYHEYSLRKWPGLVLPPRCNIPPVRPARMALLPRHWKWSEVWAKSWSPMMKGYYKASTARGMRSNLKVMYWTEVKEPRSSERNP